MIPKIIQGGRRDLIIRLIDAKTRDYYNITGVTAITTCFENVDGTELMLSLGSGITILDATQGKIQVSLTSTQTTPLRTGNAFTMEIALTFPSNPSDPLKVQIPNAYDVSQTVC